MAKKKWARYGDGWWKIRTIRSTLKTQGYCKRVWLWALRYCLPYAKVKLNPHYEPMKDGPWLLGVDSCHLQNYNPLLNSQDDKDIAKPLRWVKANTGMAEIVPAWKLADVLHSEEFTIQREKYGRDIDSRKSI